MAELSFKSVGIKNTNPTLRRTIDTHPIGIKTPLQLGRERSGLFDMHFSIADQIHDNLRNLILTNYGERLGNYDYGANLRELTTELSSKEDFDAEAMLRIKGAVKSHLPFVELETFVSKFDRKVLNSGVESVAKIQLMVKYSIPKLRITDRAISVFLYVIG
jgi:phage baseplate assembly protein W